MKYILSTFVVIMVSSLYAEVELPKPTVTIDYSIQSGGIDNSLPDFSQPLTSMQFLDTEETSFYKDFTGVYNAPFQNNFVTINQLKRIVGKTTMPYKTNFRLFGGLTHSWLSLVLYRESKVLENESIVSSMVFDNGQSSHAINNWNGVTDLEKVQHGGVLFRELSIYTNITFYLELGLSQFTETGGIEWYPNESEIAYQKSLHGYISINYWGHTATIRGYGFKINPAGYTYPERISWVPNNELQTIPVLTLNKTRYIWGFEGAVSKGIEDSSHQLLNHIGYRATFGYTIERETWGASGEGVPQSGIDSASAFERSINRYVNVSGVHSSGVGFGFSYIESGYRFNTLGAGSYSMYYPFTQIHIKPQWHIAKTFSIPASEQVHLKQLVLELFYGQKHIADNQLNLNEYTDKFNYSTVEANLNATIELVPLGLSFNILFAYGYNLFDELSMGDDYWKIQLKCSL
ncbi:MAG: hypothetical protein OCD01_14330 [Fibrobacterales bacterium]